ncbi:MAG: response regulator transcription factor [Gammaproteobacteria bacterium]|nr:response regulator transcription factor [Gammaproteobacteria bacterium]
MDVLLVDDHVFTRDGVALFLERTFPSVHAFHASDCAEALQIANQRPLNLVLMDIRFSAQGHEGMDALVTLKREFNSLCVVIFTGMDYDQALVFDALRKGAMGFIPKNLPRREDFEAALRQVLSGFPYMPVSVIGIEQKSLASYKRKEDGFLAPSDPTTLALTTRQFEIVRLLVHHGLTNDEIAKKLNITEQTVKNQLSVIYHRFNVGTRHKLIIEINKLGIVLGEPAAGNR